MKDATIQVISSIEPHTNADLLEIASVLGFKAIVRKGQFKASDVIAYITPDSVLPDKPWAAFYKAKSSRVRAIKLRDVWSEGIIETLDTVVYTGPVDPGLDISEAIGVTHYVPPLPQEPGGIGPYPHGIPKTDEERVEGLLRVPWGELVDVTLKIDGSSFSAFYKVQAEADADEMGIGGRNLMFELDSDNPYARAQRQYDVLAKLAVFCYPRRVSLCIRGECYGNGLQSGAHNPYSKMSAGLALFSTWLIDERCYARKGHPYYIFDIANEMGLPTVPVLERDVVLTPELVAKYATGLEKINGQPFEGVVINWSGGSFKVLSKVYDSKK